MCDDATEADNEVYLETARLNRRQVGMGAGAAVAALLTGCPSPPPTQEPTPVPTPTPTASGAEAAAPPATHGRMVEVQTPDGTAEAFFVTPESGKHPGVIMWPDVAGLREAYMKMATRLANQGYAVLAVNPYYRSAKLPVLTTFAEWRTEEGRAKIAPMRAALTADAVTSDAAAFVAWLDAQKEVDRERKQGAAGYCMGGPFTFRTAAATPGRVGVAASFHGSGLVTTEPTSPHALLPEMKAAVLCCIAQNDDEKEPEAKLTLRQAADAANIDAEVEVYPAQHGFCTLDSPVYDEVQAERAWARLLATFERAL